MSSLVAAYRLHGLMCSCMAFGLVAAYRLHGLVSSCVAFAEAEGAVKRFDCLNSCKHVCQCHCAIAKLMPGLLQTVPGSTAQLGCHPHAAPSRSLTVHHSCFADSQRRLANDGLDRRHHCHWPVVVPIPANGS